jgi:hypothetical protein
MQWAPQLYPAAMRMTHSAAKIIEAFESLSENFRLPVLYADMEGFSKKGDR